MRSHAQHLPTVSVWLGTPLPDKATAAFQKAAVRPAGHMDAAEGRGRMPKNNKLQESTNTGRNTPVLLNNRGNKKRHMTAVWLLLLQIPSATCYLSQLQLLRQKIYGLLLHHPLRPALSDCCDVARTCGSLDF